MELHAQDCTGSSNNCVLPECGWPANLSIHNSGHSMCDSNAAKYFALKGYFVCTVCKISEAGFDLFKKYHKDHVVPFTKAKKNYAYLIPKHQVGGGRRKRTAPVPTSSPSNSPVQLINSGFRGSKFTLRLTPPQFRHHINR